ncbi:MAG: putative baseplate assembly protein [Pseudonocardiaceae bacterium]
MTVTAPQLDACGCCGAHPEEQPINNPPGLSSLAYRSGTHGSALRRMLADLAERLPALTVRSTDDASVALLDAWAIVVDVVTFYQERIVNEGYLRTATERRSVLELARAIGYELRPGVAAATHLAFQVETAPGAPPSAVVGERTKVRSVPGQGELPQTFETSEEITADAARNEIALRTRWPQKIETGRKDLYLAGVDTGLRPGDAILLVGDGTNSDQWDFRILLSVTPLPSSAPDEPSTTRIAWDVQLGTAYPPEAQQPTVYAFRLRAALFGYNAPDWRTMPTSVRRSYAPDDTFSDFVKRTEWPRFALPNSGNPEIDLDAAYPAVGKGAWLVLRKPGKEELYHVEQVDLAARGDFGITGKTTRIKLDRLDKLSDFGIRETTVYTQTEALTLAEEPIRAGETIQGSDLVLDHPAPLAKGMPVIVQGTTPKGATVTEVRRVAGVVGAAETITLDQQLAKPLLLDSVRILGNVVAATHGETVDNEVLGSGDATAAHQRFTLRKKELTHISAPTPSGVAGTLELRVDGVRWEETPSLFTAGPRDRVYVVRIDNEAKATVVFGDGERGARLPTGQENVRARYRSGIGPAGNVAAGALSLLPQRPLGISTVGNPLPAAGGTAPENLEDARANAPLTVLALDRVVSLRDYQDFARAFGGIAKAQAVALWGGAASFVHVTVAAPGGDDVDATALDNLRAAFDSVRDRGRELRIKSYLKRKFRVGVAVLADPAYLKSAVHLDVAAALRTAYAFDRRSFGQHVTAAEVITVVQAVPGVVAVTLTALHLGETPEVEEVIIAHDARLDPTGTGPDGVVAAELLLVDPGWIAISELAP